MIAGLKSYNAYSAFEEIRQIGDGHQGSAVLLRDPWTGQCVVCKRVRVDCRSSAKLQQLEREVCVLHQMSHPNIISYLGSFQVGDTLNIITEHAAGDTLARKISMQAGSRGQHAGAAFASGRVVRWTTQLASALEHVHARAVLHRDVKSRNVFLSASDEIKLGDFGLATRLSPGIDLATSYCGTPLYISPEMACGKPYGAPADVWGVGVILYELLTLRRPFEAGSSLLVLSQRIALGEVDEPEALAKAPHPRALTALAESSALLHPQPELRLTLAGLLAALRSPAIEAACCCSSSSISNTRGGSATSSPGKRSPQRPLSNDGSQKATGSQPSGSRGPSRRESREGDLPGGGSAMRPGCEPWQARTGSELGSHARPGSDLGSSHAGPASQASPAVTAINQPQPVNNQREQPPRAKRIASAPILAPSEVPWEARAPPGTSKFGFTPGLHSDERPAGGRSCGDGTLLGGSVLGGGGTRADVAASPPRVDSQLSSQLSESLRSALSYLSRRPRLSNDSNDGYDDGSGEGRRSPPRRLLILPAALTGLPGSRGARDGARDEPVALGSALGASARFEPPSARQVAVLMGQGPPGAGAAEALAGDHAPPPPAAGAMAHSPPENIPGSPISARLHAAPASVIPEIVRPIASRLANMTALGLLGELGSLSLDSSYGPAHDELSGADSSFLFHLSISRDAPPTQPHVPPDSPSPKARSPPLPFPPPLQPAATNPKSPKSPGRHGAQDGAQDGPKSPGRHSAQDGAPKSPGRHGAQDGAPKSPKSPNNALRSLTRVVSKEEIAEMPDEARELRAALEALSAREQLGEAQRAQLASSNEMLRSRLDAAEAATLSPPSPLLAAWPYSPTIPALSSASIAVHLSPTWMPLSEAAESQCDAARLPPPMPLLPAATFEGAHEGAQGAHGDHDERHEATPKDELAEGRILVVCRDRRRLLVDVSEAISDAGDLSILGVRTQSHRNGLATMEFHLGGPTRECIALSVEAVKKVDGVQQAFMFAGAEMQFN